MGDAKVKISMADGILEFEGSESFVNEQLTRFSDAILGSLKATGASADVAKGQTETKKGEVKGNEQTNKELADIFEDSEKGVQILKDIPGDNQSAKMVNAAKLLLYGTQKLTQKDTLFFSDVSATCKSHGCLDATNMSAALKGDKESFIFGGSGKRQTLKLTVPGTRAAAKLVASLRAADGSTE
jgi:hypothetical protein